jgi:D-alanyl-D-alanine carboxypeptidase
VTVGRACRAALLALLLPPACGIGQSTISLHDKISAYLRPYVSTGNFSGSILVLQNGKILFRDSFGFSDIARQTPNTVDTKFHVASVSMPFTAATVMRLVEKGKLSLDPGVPSNTGDTGPVHPRPYSARRTRR